jgi:hypothetical protein
MCDQVDKTIDHLLVSFIFARQFWFSLLWQVNLHALSLQPEDAPFPVWWKRTDECVVGAAGRGLNSLIILQVWTLEATE